MFALVFAVVHARANTIVKREDLFRRAFSSASYILSSALLDEAFLKTLTADETQMMHGLRELARDARNREWANLEKIPIIPPKNLGEPDRLFYVFTGSRAGGEERWQSVPLRSNFGLLFSDDSSLFQLKPNEPARSASTTESLTAPIFINSQIINNPSLKIDLPQALQILLHELGHKLGAAKKQTAVDSFAAKMKTFVEAKAAYFPMRQGRVATYKFSSEIFDEWMEVSLQGRYQGVNQPNRVEPFSAFSGEGLYVIAETPTGVTDLTKSITDDWIRRSQAQSYETGGYEWRHFHFFQPYSLLVRESNGHLRIEINAEHAESPIPFYRAQAPDPQSYQPWSRIFSNGEAGQRSNERAEWSFQLSPNSIRKVSYRPRPLVFEAAKTIAKKLGSHFEGDDLILRFEVPDQVEVKGSGVERVRAFLIATLDRQPFEIEGSRDPNDPKAVNFRLGGARNLLAGELQTLNVEVEPLVRNLAKPFYVRSRLFLDQSEKHLLTGKPSEPSSLLSIEAHKASGWAELTGGNFSADDLLRITMKSAAPIRGLQVEIQTQAIDKVTSKTTIGAQAQITGSGEHILPKKTHTVVIPYESLKQELSNGILQVSFDLKTQIATKNLWIDDITPPDLPGWSRQAGGMKMVEEHLAELTPERKLIGIEILDAGMRTHRYGAATRKSFSCRAAF